jgi:site-specific DNA recombinase
MSDPQITPMRAAIYARVSTAEQAEEGFSADEQRARCRAHIEAQGWQLVATFADEGTSGSIAMAERPQGRDLIAALADLDVVVTPALDRLGRSQRDLADQFERYAEAGVSVASLREPSIDGTDASATMIRGVFGLFAQFERDVGRERTRAGIRSRVATERKPWATPAYGYEGRGDGHWQVRDREAEVVRRVFAERVEQGRSYSAISRRLNRDRVPTRNAAGQWTGTMVQRILSGRAVRGEFQFSGGWHPGQHPPIITEDTWQAARALAESGRKFQPKGGRVASGHLFVGGQLRCGICGGSMAPRAEGDRYVCRTRRARGVEACSMPPIKRAEIEAPMLRLFEESALDVEATRRNVAEQIDRRLGEVRALAEDAARQVADLDEQRDRLRGDYRAGRLEVEEWREFRDEIASERTAAQANADRLAEQAESVGALAANLDAEHELLRRLAELRAAVAERVRSGQQRAHSAEDVGALRAAIGAVFEEIHLRPAEDPITAIEGYSESAEPGPQGYYIEPHIRQDVIEDFADDGTPIFARVGLQLEATTTAQLGR